VTFWAIWPFFFSPKRIKTFLGLVACLFFTRSFIANMRPDPKIDGVGDKNSFFNIDPRFTSMIVAFGQFVDHDLDHVPVPRSKFHFLGKQW
jgi:hypothetical protein